MEESHPVIRHHHIRLKRGGVKQIQDKGRGVQRGQLRKEVGQA